MPLQIRLVTSPSDYPTLAHIKYDAFVDNTLNQLMYPSTTVNPQALQTWFIAREERDAKSPYQRTVAVVDSQEGEIIAYAKWELPSALIDESKQSDAKVDLGPMPKLPGGVNLEVCGLFRNGLDGMREKWGDKRETFELHSLATHPSHQGRGCAGLLLRWGIEQADAAGKKCYLESTPAAFPVYRKYGWVKIDEVIIDTERFGGRREVVAIMLREPRSGK